MASCEGTEYGFIGREAGFLRDHLFIAKGVE
jgi:hypothetical protein